VATETLTIALTDGYIQGSDYFVGDEDDTQYVTLIDGGVLSSIIIKNFGKDTATESGEGDGGDDEFYIDLSDFNDDFSVEVMSMDPGDSFYVSGALSWSNVGNVCTVYYIGSDGLVHELTIDVESTNGTGVASIVITCFAKGTMIQTTNGPLPVETLAIGDKIMCGDGTSRRIRWFSERYISEDEMLENPDFRPICIRKDALGDNVPNQDLVVSPQHRVLLSDWRAELLFGAAEVLVPAVHLADDKNITRDHQAKDVTYYHFMFDEHQTVWSNGLESESFFPGDTAINGVEDDARCELYRLFPELEDNPTTYGATYRPTLKAHEVMSMMGG
jgi:hypothetical protein